MGSEFSAIFQLAGQLQALRQEAAHACVHACLPEVENIIARKVNDPQRIERLLDRLLDVAFDENALQLFKRLCLHYWFIDPHATASYVQAYRELWDEESLERPRETSKLIATEQVSEQQTEQVTRLLAAMGGTPLSAREIMTKLGLTHRPTFLYSYLQPALADGLIEMTRPDAPRARNQKYRKTAKDRHTSPFPLPPSPFNREGTGHGE